MICLQLLQSAALVLEAGTVDGKVDHMRAGRDDLSSLFSVLPLLVITHHEGTYSLAQLKKEQEVD